MKLIKKTSSLLKIISISLVLFSTLFSPVYAEVVGGIELPVTTLPDPAGGTQAILSGLLNWMLVMFLILALIAFIVTGIMYLVALGDSRSQQIENAKNYFVFAIKALLIVGGSVVIIYSIKAFLEGTLPLV